MAIFLCNKCGYLREVSNNYIGKSATCPKCQNSAVVYDTVPFVSKMVKKCANLSAQVAQPETTEVARPQTSELRIRWRRKRIPAILRIKLKT